MYIDGVFYARPASATLDFLDVAQVEVLARTAGDALRQEHHCRRDQRHQQRPNFSPESNVELAYGSFDFVQAKASLSGPLSDKVAGRISFSGTGRDGFIFNTQRRTETNTLNNLGFRGQLLIAPSKSRRHERGGGPHAAAPGRIRAGDRRCRADAPPGQSAIRSRSLPISATRHRATTRSIG